ncbi:MAG TPA: AAA family ATPase [Lacipirellulaceae bacterium]|nr:AAA family ATPase [Lacipirellulaceae bacterium]
MKITDLKIDGFGVWHDLTLRGLSPELTVFYGPNEAGKSTLMQFMRSILYGMTPTRRERYLPPVVGGRPGGWLKVDTDHGPLTISRYADRGPTDVGKVTIITGNGEEQGDRLLREGLEHVDEPTYLNIFAVGLREVQELNSLSDTAAAQWLYRLTSGMDRISLYDVIHMLEGTRLRLLNNCEEKSELRSLLAHREQLNGELQELITKGRRWTQSAVKLRELAEEVEAKQAEAKALATRARRLEVAISLKPLWIKRGKIDDQLERFANLQPLPEGAIEAHDEHSKRIEEHERQRDIHRGQRHQLRDEAKRLGINDQLIRSGKRLEALLEQQDWLQGVERQASELADEVKHLEARLESEHERLAHEWTGAGKLPPRLSSDIVEQLAPQTRAIEATSQLVQEAKDELEHHQTGENEMRSQIESATISGEKLGLPTDIEAAGDLVTQLRHRQALEQKINAAHGEAESLQQQAEDLVDEQVIPIELFVFLGFLFVLGIMAVAAWWFLPASLTGGYSGWVALGGVGATVIAGMIKFLSETSASDRFDACHYQIDALLEKIETLDAEEAELDHALKLNGGSVGLRLQHAERHLAELERVMPVENQHREVKQAVSTADRRLKQAEEKHAAALANWKSRLRAMGLPETVTPQNLAIMAAQSERLAELETRIENRRTEMQLRQREFNLVSQRIFTLAEETGLRLPAAGGAVAGLSEAGSSRSDDAKPRKQAAVQSGSQTASTIHPLVQLDHIRGEHNKHTQRVEQRQSVRDRAKALKVEAVKHHHAAVGHRRRREALFQKCGVANEQELRALAAKLTEADELRAKRTATTREIVAAIGRHGVEADFAPVLVDDQIGRLEHDWETLSTQSEELDRHLKDALQRRGAMVEQQRTAAADQSLGSKQVELNVVEEQITKAVDAWRERAAVSLFLERIRKEYEQHRQPETLREASEYMSQLTDGKYKRIWTPLAHDILFVDNAEGQSLSVQVLSRGTREQLFVSLRLALVAAYARRGIHLPMILDDVFVNYDAGRTRTAAAVLKKFAKQGHQLLVFTCHEHVWQMFKDISVDTRRIPNRHGELTDEQPETPQPEVVPEPVPEPAVISAAEPQPPAPSPPPQAASPEPLVEPVKVKKSRPKPPPVEVPELIIEEPEEVFYEEPAPIAASPPAVTEIEYWWDTPTPANSNGASHHEDPAPRDWLPEPEIRGRW